MRAWSSTSMARVLVSASSSDWASGGGSSVCRGTTPERRQFLVQFLVATEVEKAIRHLQSTSRGSLEQGTWPLPDAQIWPCNELVSSPAVHPCRLQHSPHDPAGEKARWMEHLTIQIFIFSFPQQQIKYDFFKHISEPGLMIIDHSYSVINLRKCINHLMPLFLIQWCETLIYYWNQIQKFKLLLGCALFLWSNAERGVFSRSCGASHVHLHQAMLPVSRPVTCSGLCQCAQEIRRFTRRSVKSNHE